MRLRADPVLYLGKHSAICLVICCELPCFNFILFICTVILLFVLFYCLFYLLAIFMFCAIFIFSFVRLSIRVPQCYPHSSGVPCPIGFPPASPNGTDCNPKCFPSCFRPSGRPSTPLGSATFAYFSSFQKLCE